MPVLPRQLGLASQLSQASEALQSRISTASAALFSTPVVVAPTLTSPVQQTVPTVVSTAIVTETAPLPTLTQSVAPLTSNVVTPTPTPTPTISVIVFTTTTSAPDVSTTQAVTSSINALSSSSDAIPSSSPVPSLVLTTPAVSTPEAEASSVPTTSRLASSASASGTGVPANASSSTQSASGMSGGIIALIVVGALLAALLAGAFTFRRVQVYRRAKRRENNYGAGPIVDTAPFPFTNVSETDLKGAEPITRDFRQGGAPSISEKPLPGIAPVEPSYAGLNLNPNFAQPAFGNNMSGPYPTMGAAGYGYGQNERTGSPAPRMMSPAPPAPFMRTASPAPSGGVPPNQYPAAPTPALTVPAPASDLAPHLRGRKRVVQTFQPTLPDELDIRDGDWVTVVHAYDDGWGLCERNGRRGVVPLECLDLGRPDVRASRRLSSLSAIRQ